MGQHRAVGLAVASAVDGGAALRCVRQAATSASRALAAGLHLSQVCKELGGRPAAAPDLSGPAQVHRAQREDGRRWRRDKRMRRSASKMMATSAVRIQVVRVVGGFAQLGNLRLVLGVHQVETPSFSACSSLVGGLQLLVASLQLFIAGLQLLVGAFQLFDGQAQLVAYALQLGLQLGNVAGGGALGSTRSRAGFWVGGHCGSRRTRWLLGLWQARGRQSVTSMRNNWSGRFGGRGSHRARRRTVPSRCAPRAISASEMAVPVGPALSRLMRRRAEATRHRRQQPAGIAKHIDQLFALVDQEATDPQSA